MTIVHVRLRMLALLPAVFAVPALADEIDLQAPIAHVTVYREGANITREALVQVPAGEHWLVAKGLPANLEPKAVRIAIDSQQVLVGAVDFDKVNSKDFVSDAEKTLRAKVQDLQDRRAGVADEMTVAETELKLLDSLAGSPTGSATRPAVDAGSLASVLNTVNTGGTAARRRMRDASIRLRAIDAEIKAASDDLAKISTARKETYTARIAVRSEQAASARLSFQYLLDDASWDWVYQARLDSEAREVNLERQASVEQSTGEDWSNVALTLTTAVPSENAAPVELGSLLARLSDDGTAGIAGTTSNRMPASSNLQEIVVTARKAEARTTATEFIVDYDVPAKASIASDREPRLFPIAQERFKVDLVARVVPSRSPSAYVMGAFHFDGSAPIQPGEMQLFRDGAFVGVANTRGFMPGSDVRMPFGADERIQVEVQEDAAKSRDGGFLSRDRIEESRQRFSILSYHAMPMKVEVIDRMPVPKDAAIHVASLKDATPPTQSNFDDKEGLLMWQVDANPKQKAVVKHYWSISYPADRELEVEDESEDESESTER